MSTVHPGETKTELRSRCKRGEPSGVRQRAERRQARDVRRRARLDGGGGRRLGGAVARVVRGRPRSGRRRGLGLRVGLLLGGRAAAHGSRGVSVGGRFFFQLVTPCAGLPIK
jgi:hypothetical protein